MSRCPECNVNGVIVKDGCLTCGGWGIVPDITVSEHEEAIAEKDQRIAALEAERDAAELIKIDLATLVRRLCRKCGDAKLIEQATDYLKRKNLQGSILR